MEGQGKPRVLRGQLTFHQHDSNEGLAESSAEFGSLEELYELCIGVSGPTLIDRLVIHGQDQRGGARVVTFSFHTMTVTSGKSSTGILSKLFRRES